MMSCRATLQAATAAAAGEVVPPLPVAAAGDWNHPAVCCPKPRRVAQLVGAFAGADLQRLPKNGGLAGHHHGIYSDSNAAADLLDIFSLAKDAENNNNNNNSQMACSPPFFVGSPPTRSGNPVVNDARFGEDRPVGPGLWASGSPGPAQPAASAVGQLAGSPMSPSARKGCGPTKVGFKPAAVRVEGFDCIDRCDHRPSRSITAVA